MAAAGDDLSRRGFLERLLSLAAVPVVGRAVGAAEMVDDPYAEVDWETCQHLHSMSHQHQGQSAASLDLFYAMGYRHLAFSNYYPSAPTIPPAEWLAAHPDALECANAEHHSFTDSSAHCNALGSRTRTGAGWSAKVPTSSPHEHTFSGLNVFRAERPWDGVYRLDLKLAAQGSAAPAAEVSLAGGLLAQNTGELIGDGSIAAMAWDARRGSILFRATAAEARVTLRFDPATTRVTQFRLMQGSNRPWRDVFRACLEGELIDGQRVGGLEFADGGGMTINHPTGSDLDPYLAMLDFDPRVLGIEVFNHLTDGFGAARTTTARPPQHFVELWDRILASGRRCLGFFVKDHRTCAVGRNVLLVPPAAGRSHKQRRHDALRAYRHGAFYGCIGASATADGALVPPYDLSGFRFARHSLVRDAQGVPERLEVEVAGGDPRRPQVQIRFVTEQGLALVCDGPRASFTLPRAGGRPALRFVRVEAFAYPTQVGGQPLTAADFGRLRVAEIWRLHDHTVDESCFYTGGGKPGPEPIGVVDLLFAQPLRFAAG